MAKENTNTPAKETTTPDKDNNATPGNSSGTSEGKAAAKPAQSLVELSKSSGSFEERVKPLISQKVRAGLTREQAIQVIKRQIARNPKQVEAALAAATKKA